MSRQIQIRRGTADENDEFIGAIGEITMDTTNNTLRVHDGETVGGTALAKKSDLPDLDSIDYVVESQFPTPENNYTWYRKYKSGWIEQGGVQNSNTTHPTNTTLTINLPIEMADTNYILIVKSSERISTSSNPLGEQYANSCFGVAGTKTTTSFTYRGHKPSWYICGLSASL